jgi:hypothetical protein
MKGHVGCGNGYVGPQGCPQKLWITLTSFSTPVRYSLHCCKSLSRSGRRYLMNGSYQRSILDKRGQRGAVGREATGEGYEDDCTKTLGLGVHAIRRDARSSLRTSPGGRYCPDCNNRGSKLRSITWFCHTEAMKWPTARRESLILVTGHYHLPCVRGRQEATDRVRC